MSSGIKICEVRISNFRSLVDVRVLLDDTTILLGENNSGKSSFIAALQAAIGIGRKDLNADDVFVAPDEDSAPQNRNIVIDILIRPVNESGQVADKFPEGSFWLDLWGSAVGQDEEDNDFLGIRTRLHWNKEKGDYIFERKFLKQWPTSLKNWTKAKLNESVGAVGRNHLEPIAVYVMDAKRDIQEDLSSRTSFWNKLVKDLKLPEATVTDIETQLKSLNSDILRLSPVLSHASSELKHLDKTIVCDSDKLAIVSLPRKLSEISRKMDITFATKGAQSFPIARHGMGTRSLAAVLAFKAYSSWQAASQSSSKFHPFLALEEPEAHLHPHAQQALYEFILTIPGQRLISTHSPYIARYANPLQIRHFSKKDASTTVKQIESLTEEEVSQIRRWVLDSRGDILYARAIVLAEGQSEEVALPIIAESHWNAPPASMGISFVSVGGQNFSPFIRLAQALDIPWYAFTDGEADYVERLQKTLSKVGASTSDRNVIIRPGGENWETSLARPEYKAMLIDIVLERECGNNETYAQSLRSELEGATDFKKVLDFMRGKKVDYAKRVALGLRTLDEKHRIPGELEKLFATIDRDLTLR